MHKQLQRQGVSVDRCTVERLMREHGLEGVRRNVHEIAQELEPETHVVYVDNDPIVLAHGRALLATNAATTVITADIRDPAAILDDPELGTLIDFSQPVAVLFVAIFHFIRDSEGPAGILAAFRERLAPGSCLALSHLTTDGPDAGEIDQVTDVYKTPRARSCSALARRSPVSSTASS